MYFRYNNTIRIHYKLKGWNTTTNQDNGEQYGDGGYVDIPMNGYTTAGSQTNFPAATITLPIDLMSVGDSARIEISLDPVRLILASGVFCDTLVNNYLGYTTLGCDDYSKIDLPEGMPKDVFKDLKKVRLSGQQLKISVVKKDQKSRYSAK